jgi:hypothetical protein
LWFRAQHDGIHIYIYIYTHTYIYIYMKLYFIHKF